MHKILLLNGPNLNLLGRREPEIYGSDTLADIEHRAQQLGHELGLQVECLQSNAEHRLIERIHQTLDDGTEFIIFNPAAFTHTSLALRDALLAVRVPFAEVHLSDITQRESYRRHSWFSDIAATVISGQGAAGYEQALRFAAATLTQKLNP